MQDLEQIKTVLNSSAGKALKSYLIARTNELKDITNIKEFSTTATQTLELKAQLRAYTKLRQIMEEIMLFETSKNEKNDLDGYEVF